MSPPAEVAFAAITAAVAMQAGHMRFSFPSVHGNDGRPKRRSTSRALFVQGGGEGADDNSESDSEPQRPRKKSTLPWPVRRGGLFLWLYERSLSTALFILFAASFVLHAWGGAARYNADQLLHGQSTVTTFGYIGRAEFWFESFQNWQSEFLSIAVLILLSIVLRERGSPQSKPVAAPYSETG